MYFSCAFFATLSKNSIIVSSYGIGLSTYNIFIYYIILGLNNGLLIQASQAIGAKNNDILLQFLIEAIVLTLLGAIIGIIIGVGISAIIAFIATYLGYEWSFVITTSSVLISCFISIIIGIIFGVNPAYKASKLNSIEALRYE